MIRPSEDLCLTAHNTHSTHTSMPPAGFEPTMPASERPQTPQRCHRDSAVLLNCELGMIINEAVVACVKLSPRIVRMLVRLRARRIEAVGSAAEMCTGVTERL